MYYVHLMGMVRSKTFYDLTYWYQSKSFTMKWRRGSASGQGSSVNWFPYLNTHTWGIPETFDRMEDWTANCSHSKGSTTIVHNPPGTETGKKHYCFTGLSNSHVRVRGGHPGLTNLSPGLAPFALNKLLGLAWPYLTLHWAQKKYVLSICIYSKQVPMREKESPESERERERMSRSL